jgi:hypothetical protein
MRLERYTSEYSADWDNLIDGSRNGTFLLFRAYMDYHRERFLDHSVLIYLNEKIIAVFAADEYQNIIRCHGGLTYGGLILGYGVSCVSVVEIFRHLINYYAEHGLDTMIYKPVPSIYHRLLSEEVLYALHLNKARLYSRSPSTTIDLESIELSGSKRRGSNKARRNGLLLKEAENTDRLMELIDSNLMTRYGVGAVHSTREMELLKTQFPSYIDIFEIINESDEIMGGAIVYISYQVAHVQYMVASEMGRTLRSMDLLIFELIECYKSKLRYLDFGISSVNNGYDLNVSLISQKEEFGGTCVCYDAYEIDLPKKSKNYKEN